MKLSLAILAILAIALFLSCGDETNNPTIPNSISNNEVSKEDNFLTNEKLENELSKHTPIFLSYWTGMDEEMVVEVSRYLLEKDKIYGVIQCEDSLEGYSVDWSINLSENGPCKDINKATIKHLKYHPFQLFTTIEGKRFRINFEYDELGELMAIRLFANENEQPDKTKFGMKPEKTKFEMKDFELVKRLFDEKYGAVITQKQNKDGFIDAQAFYSIGNGSQIKLVFDKLQTLKGMVHGRKYDPYCIEINYFDKAKWNKKIKEEERIKKEEERIQKEAEILRKKSKEEDKKRQHREELQKI